MPKKKRAVDPNPPAAWTGHICFNEKKHGIWLLLTGVKLGKETEGGWFPCELTHEVFLKVEPYWGTFFWALTPVRVSA